MRRIQNTVQVTRATAMIDRVPPSASCASELSWLDPYFSRRRSPPLSSVGASVGAVAAVPLGPWVEYRRKRPVLIATDLVWFGALTFL